MIIPLEEGGAAATMHSGMQQASQYDPPTLHQLNLKSDALLLRIIITLLRTLAAAVQRGIDARPQALPKTRPFLRCEGSAIIFTNWFDVLNAVLCRHCCCSRRWLAIHPCTCATDGLPTRGEGRRCCCCTNHGWLVVLVLEEVLVVAMTMFLTAFSYVRSVVGPSTAAIIYGSLTS
jgi:hypothetical protein